MSLNCYHCHQPDHLKADCPFLAPCGQAEHYERIEHFVTRWQDGALTVGQKRQLISDENQLYHGAGCPSRLLWYPSSL